MDCFANDYEMPYAGLIEGLREVESFDDLLSTHHNW